MPIADAQSADDMPAFEVDAAWPKPLPNSWAVGPVSGIATDARDHIWIIHRGEAVKQAGGVPAPPVIEFDAAGNVVQTWGGPGDRLRVAAAGTWHYRRRERPRLDQRQRRAGTRTSSRSTRAGKFLRQIGRAGQSGGSNDHGERGPATQMRVDLRSNEVYVSDGEQNQNHRVIVFDSETGAYKRHWGAYGEKPDDAAANGSRRSRRSAVQTVRQCRALRPHRSRRPRLCVRSEQQPIPDLSQGRPLSEGDLRPEAVGRGGTVGDIDFSPDQTFLYVADGANQKVWILRRDQLRVVGSFGERGTGRRPVRHHAARSDGRFQRKRVHGRGGDRRPRAEVRTRSSWQAVAGPFFVCVYQRRAAESPGSRRILGSCLGVPAPRR